MLQLCLIQQPLWQFLSAQAVERVLDVVRGKNKQVKGFVRERVHQWWLGVRDGTLCFAGALSQLLPSRIFCFGLTLELLLVTLV